MALELPIYLLAGEKPISVTQVPGGGIRILGWDFEAGELNRNVEWDDVVGHLQSGVKVKGSAHFAEGGDTYPISREEFEQRVAELRSRSTSGQG